MEEVAQDQSSDCPEAGRYSQLEQVAAELGRKKWEGLASALDFHMEKEGSKEFAIIRRREQVRLGPYCVDFRLSQELPLGPSSTQKLPAIKSDMMSREVW